jgi:hypothetical protein
MRALTLVAAGVVVAVLTAGASAVPPRNCGTFRFKSDRYMVVVHGVTCRFGRTWDVRYLRNRAHPRGYHCLKPNRGSNLAVDCTGGTRPKGDKSPRNYYEIST